MKNPHQNLPVRSRRRLVGLAAALAAVGLSTVTAATAVGAAGRHAPPPHHSPGVVGSAPLRALAAPLGLRVGVAVNPARLSDPAYASIVSGQFSTITPENQMKWDAVEPSRGTYDWSAADQVVSWAQQHGQKVRGHTLLWHNQIPSWLTSGVADGSISNDQLRALLKKHITDEVGHFRGKIWQWDVANEFFADSWSPQPLPNGMNGDDFWVSHLGTGIVADAFRWAHAADPHALLFYNDYNIAGEDGTNAKADAVYAWVKQLRAQGVPIDGVGDQGHLDTQYGFDGTRMQADLERYARLGLKVAITEADVRTFVDAPSTQVPTDSLAQFAQPDEFVQMLTACLQVRSCLSFTIWDVDDADSWVPGTFSGEGAATLYDVNLAPKTSYTAVQQTLALANGVSRRR